MPKNLSEEVKKVTMAVVSRGPYKFKDTIDRRQVMFDFKTIFDFIPEKIIIEKVPEENNTIMIHAIKPDNGPKIYVPSKYGKN